MSYSLPFKPEDKVIELGGGNTNIFRPNVDVRQCYDAKGNPTVDFTADFDKPLPIKSEEWDGVYCSYCLEHIPWGDRLKNFIKEIYRILKSQGTAVLITSNTEAQMKHLLATEDWDDAGSMLFGTLDYPENSHKCFLSPSFATKLFKEIGFEKVTIIPFGIKNTDMIIEATKNETPKYDKHYFHGGHYKGEGYRDFPFHWVEFKKIMNLKPTSALEIGCSRGFLLKRLQDAGIPVGGFDISLHCLLTRAMNGITEWDVCNVPWPVPDKFFDVCYSTSFLQCLPKDKIPAIANEINRIANRSFHSVELDERNMEWWKEKMPGHNIITSEEMKKPDGLMWDYIPVGDDKVKVNVGSFTNQFHDWINIDILDLNEYAKQNYYKFIQKDVREGLPFENDSVDLMFTSHFIEHLTYDEGRKFLGECKRVMKKDATIRILCPDAELLIDKYKSRELAIYHEINDGAEAAPTQAGKLWALLFSGHQATYDFETLKVIGNELGFDVKKRGFRQGHSQIIKETIDMLPELSLFVEMTKV